MGRTSLHLLQRPHAADRHVLDLHRVRQHYELLMDTNTGWVLLALIFSLFHAWKAYLNHRRGDKV